MTQEETLEYNKLCAEFLGYVNTTPTDKDFNIYQNKDGKMLEPMSMKFHSDWNWIMEVKEKICQLDIVDEFNTEYDSVAKGFHCSILPAYKNTFDGVYTKVLNTEKEAVVQAINQFLIWHEQNKTQ